MNPEATATVRQIFWIQNYLADSPIPADKVIIAQDSLQHFINAVSPRAYVSATKVDFKTLDRFMIKPLGIYGSKPEIVRLLQSIGAVDEDT